jgi:hypothetical protein
MGGKLPELEPRTVIVNDLANDDRERVRGMPETGFAGVGSWQRVKMAIGGTENEKGCSADTVVR